jgi:uncharacterized protein YecE (DUF72 family)
VSKAKTGNIRVGLSGWRYDGWRGVFYPPRLRQDDELAFAAGAFPSIELNGSFYSLQRPESYERWYAATPPGFVFAVKGGRYITHYLQLREVERALANFFASGVLALNEKLGPFLWQFPPRFGYDRARMAAFLASLPRDSEAALALARRRDGRMKGRARLSIDRNRPLRHAVEIRHPSFECADFVALLRANRVALVVADTAGSWPYREDVTADFLYLRLHGDRELYASGYTDRALARWARRIRAWAAGREPADARRIVPRAAPAAGPRDVYVYFDNDVKVRAPFDADRLMRMLRLERADAAFRFPPRSALARARPPAPLPPWRWRYGRRPARRADA